MGNGLLQSGFNPVVIDDKNDVLNGFWQGLEISITGQTQHGIATRVDRVYFAVKTTGQQVMYRAPPHGAGSFCGTQNRDRAWAQQGIEFVRHGLPEQAYQSAGGVWRRRGGSKKASLTTLAFAFTRLHLSSRW